MSQTSKPVVSKEGAPPTKPKRAEQEGLTRAGGARGALPLGAITAEVDAWTRASQLAVIGLFVIALLWCCYVAQPVIVPVMLAWAIATIVLPIVTWIHERGVPRVLAAILVTLLLFLIIVSLLGLLSTPVAYWLGRATEIGTLIKQKLQTMGQPLALLDELQKAVSAIGTGDSPLRVEAQQSTLGGTMFCIRPRAVRQCILSLGR